MNRLAKVLISLAIVSCAGQLIWFGGTAIHRIDYDGMAYTGIAAELRLGQIRESINAFRSPLLSWLIAVAPSMTVLHAGKLITIVMFLVTLLLLYVFTFNLWNSHVAAGIAVLLLTLARGLSLVAVAFVTPDFLLAALVLAYFIFLLRYLRNEQRGWWAVGIVHGFAYLAKAIALPWLTLCTSVSAMLSTGNWKTRFVRLGSAIAIPALIVVIWGSALHSKYGVFTSGSQFKANLMQWTLREILPKQPTKYRMLRDVAESTDSHMVDDPMPPGSWGWSYRPKTLMVLPRIFAAEGRNIPKALKELLILSTPGIPLALILTCLPLYRHGSRSPEFILVFTVMVGSAALVLAYSMLVIDTRYFFPLVPLWLAVGSKVLVSNMEASHANLRTLTLILVAVGLTFSLIYRASPFRVQTRDWQTVCYRAGESLRRHKARTVVSVGSGPFPEHGVGWEAGYTSSYFAGAWLIAASESKPKDFDILAEDVAHAAPDAVLVWDNDQRVLWSVFSALKANYSHEEPIADPKLGEVGLILYRR